MAPPRKPINHLTNKSNEEINRLKRRKISKNEMKRGASTIDLSSWGCCSTTTVVAVRRGDGGRKGQMHTLFGRPHPSSQVARRLIAVVINLSEAISSSSSSFSGGSESSFLLSSSREREEQMDLAPSFSAMATGRARARYCGSRVWVSASGAHSPERRRPNSCYDWFCSFLLFSCIHSFFFFGFFLFLELLERGPQSTGIIYFFWSWYLHCY